jgi:hypothetical protein
LIGCSMKAMLADRRLSFGLAWIAFHKASTPSMSSYCSLPSSDAW